MENVFALIDKYGFSAAVAGWMLYRDYRFLRKLEGLADQLVKFFGKEVKV